MRDEAQQGARESMRPRVGAAFLCRTDAWAGLSALDGRNFETRLPPHVHSGYVLGVIDAGTLCITSNRRAHIARPGDVIALPPFVVHTELAGGAGGWSFRYLYPTETTVRAALELPHNQHELALPFAAPVIRDDQLACTIGHAHDLMRSGANPCRIEDALCTVFRVARERHCILARTAPSERPFRSGILAVRALLTHSPLRSITLADMASVAGLSQFRFARLFRAEIGLPPYAYYEQVRIAFAHELIQQGHALSAVAYRLGYADQSHLTRHFRRASFTTPGRLAGMIRNASSR